MTMTALKKQLVEKGEGVRTLLAMKKKRILIVDDNEFFIQQQTGYLGQKRYDFHIARSGGEALEKVRSLKPDLVLLDQFMEDMTGAEVCSILKGDAATSKIPLVIVSSGEREFSRIVSEKSGCDGIIFKPIRRDLLLAIVEELLGINGRRWKRATTSIPCQMIHEEGHGSGTIHSLGAGGAFVQTGLALMVGDTCRITFDLPLTSKQVKVESAVVVWKGRDGEGENEGVGLHFLTTYPSDQEAVDQYVCSLLEFEK